VASTRRFASGEQVRLITWSMSRVLPGEDILLMTLRNFLILSASEASSRRTHDIDSAACGKVAISQDAAMPSRNFLPSSVLSQALVGLHAAECRRQATGPRIGETFRERGVDPRIAIGHLFRCDHRSPTFLPALDMVARAEGAVNLLDTLDNYCASFDCSLRSRSG
jgi:hypothetical protein